MIIGIDLMKILNINKKDILKRLHWIDSLENSSTTYPNSTHTTQLIIGANNETDKEILHRIDKICKNSKFVRVYGTEYFYCGNL